MRSIRRKRREGDRELRKQGLGRRELRRSAKG
jgi:hypothetical protein